MRGRQGITFTGSDAAGCSVSPSTQLDYNAAFSNSRTEEERLMDERHHDARSAGRYLGDIANIARGVLMGGADIIPGVSGGTVALVLGIYERLVTAISHFDLTLLRLLRAKRWAAAAAHIELRFLMTLGSGIVVGAVALASVMVELLSDYRPLTLAALFGMIVASGWLVARMITIRGTFQIATALLLGFSAGLFAFWLVGQPFLDPHPGLVYLFLCGTIAVCAMILPGISGAFILLLLGRYAAVTVAIRELVHGDVRTDNVTLLVVFSAGCAAGLIGFSKVLRWLLARHKSVTMALLCGLMIGSLRRIWPFQIDLTPNLPLKEKVFHNVWPQQFDGQVTLAIAIGVAAMFLVLAVEYWAKAAMNQPPLEAADHPTEQEVG
ncbi:MAG: DUF368 domain-containing protein [Pirellulales bacterium]